MIISRRIKWLGHVSCMGQRKGAYSGLLGKPEEKRPLGSCKHRWDDSVEMDLQEMGWDGA